MAPNLATPTTKNNINKNKPKKKLITPTTYIIIIIIIFYYNYAAISYLMCRSITGITISGELSCGR